VLLDDRFATVAAAVEEGRVIVDNIRKFVFYLFSCNVAEILLLLVAGVAGLPLPLGPLQLLWLNLVTDTFPALALALEPADKGVMARPPRPPREAILSSRFLGSVFFYAALITASTLAAFLWGLDAGARHASTLAFMTLALAQTAHLGNARSAGAVLDRSSITSNPFALAGAGLAVALQLLAVYVPAFARLLGLTTLSSRDWLAIVVLGLTPAVVGQVIKALRRSRREDPGAIR
jgi:Ca2+-transporting ATPase